MQKFIEEWQIDYKIDLDCLEESIKKVSESSGKYFKYLDLTNKEITKLKGKLTKLKSAKSLYYSGSGSEDDYKKNPLPRKYLKNEIPIIVSGDSEVIELESKLIDLENNKKMLEEMIKMISNSGFTFKNIIDWRKYQEAINC